ncbi:hypothetical protein KAJ89_00820 [Candidatus Parcubacteria bacterium]|nr:hypothetical protein [Candidatus Parcubacteria bacterium]
MIENKLPTDNLYKSIAIFGLVMLITSFIIPGIYNNKTRNDIEYFYQNYEKLGIEKSELVNINSELTNEYYVENKLLTVFLFFGGILTMVFGFVFWYFKTQKYLDIILKEKALNTKRRE